VKGLCDDAGYLASQLPVQGKGIGRDDDDRYVLGSWVLCQLGSAEYPNVVEEYEVDTGLLKELREHEKQAAQELGQWSDKARVEQGPIDVKVVWSDRDAHP
jgi:hypothetical protein